MGCSPEDDGLTSAAKPLRELISECGENALHDGELRPEAQSRHHDEEEDSPQLRYGHA